MLQDALMHKGRKTQTTQKRRKRQLGHITSNLGFSAQTCSRCLGMNWRNEASLFLILQNSGIKGLFCCKQQGLARMLNLVQGAALSNQLFGRALGRIDRRGLELAA
ncbi:hypothetical protein GQ602_001473 [Ophiocordyceps camponoti-floridani]|uniref:Uncharacterized protein n=1 Tax=Ophiocordyceps camponoti-floridani TaxID=2030778 RepID=A0A8H4VHT3_9HYPO|nr:hypothetical protein GQ602_001473 [Ophiocordyceps camponoti-floridani]